MPTGFDAKSDAAEISNAAKQKGVDGASQVFQQDLDKVKNADPSVDKNQYLTALNKELETRGLLPEMSINWAKKNFDKLDRDDNGALGLDEINFAHQTSASGSIEKAYLESLGNNYKTLSKEVNYETDRNGTPVKGISTKDVDSFLAKKTDARSNMDIASMLTGNKDFLFNALDVAHNGLNGKDGKISRSDIESFAKQIHAGKSGKLSDDDLDNEQLLSGVDKADRRKVVDTLDFLSQQKNWDSQQIQRIRDGGVISMQSLAEGLGFNQEGGKDAEIKAMKDAVKAQADDQSNQDKTANAASPESIPTIPTPGSDSVLGANSNNAPVTDAPDTYVVKSGDYLWSIAQSKLGAQATNQQILDWVNAVAAANQLADPNLINPDQKLVIPKEAGSASMPLVNPENDSDQ